ncbi:MAG TPA: glucose-6-phosphate dehydrogenase [Casimicrobiaceae bacterium]|nr:glucose-6-phosphate dehydrogenase [Casimicrobiaceae bacterium]
MINDANAIAAPTSAPADSCVMVIFGASGDLAKRKLVPALYNLARDKLLSPHFAVVGFATRDYTSETLRDHLDEAMEEHAAGSTGTEIWKWLRARIYYVSGSLQDPAAYQRLAAKVAEAAQAHGAGGNRFYYLAVAPQFIGEIVRQLGSAGLARETNGQWSRVNIEKPFGRDLDSARALNVDIRKTLGEHQIYRIDHYLGKETVQNLMVFRFGNSIFEPIWNRSYIDHVQITAAETLGVEKRGGYYETSGTLRDMVPNHLFQLVSLTAMEPPISFAADSVRDEQTKILDAIQIPTPEEVLTRTVRGQYGEGTVNGQRLSAYRAEDNVAPDSATETFVALKLGVDNWRWADVPFYLRTGKRMARRVTEIVIQFKRPPFKLFRKAGVENLATNQLVIRIQPDEGISLRFGTKVPGPTMQQAPVNMDFSYADYFGAAPSTGYERLLYDCMIGDQTLFQRADMVEAGWSIINPVLDVWHALAPRSFPNYAAGSWGPREADELLARDGHAWRMNGS